MVYSGSDGLATKRTSTGLFPRSPDSSQASVFFIFLQALNYLVDAYLMFAASAIAGNTFLRSLAGAGFPLFSQYMFKALGVNWAGTLLGCVALCLVPIPVCFYIYGEKIRRKSLLRRRAIRAG